jgi:hypothetical protein
MFSLQIGLPDGTVPADRLLEYTDDAIRDTFINNLSALQDLPVLAMPEIGDYRSEQVAHIGTAIRMRRDGREYRFAFVRNPQFSPIPLTTIEELAPELGIGHFEFRRTHWAVKNADLFQALLAANQVRRQEAPGGFGPSSAVHFPVDSPRDPQLVAVMMPFDTHFDIVYETIEAAVEDAGLRSVRADDIWEQHQVMGDISSILWRARIVISDLTGRNANVFYETGLAHALPRSTVLLTQNPGDIPFDLQAIRYLHYGLGTNERVTLRRQLAERLTTLVTQGTA